MAYPQSFPTWVNRHIDTTILGQKMRYTTKHRTHNHVAMIFQGRKIVAIGQNRAHGTGTIHAEVDVIRSLGDTTKLRGATLVVIRIASSGILNSKPCPACTCVLQKCVRAYGLRSWIHS